MSLRRFDLVIVGGGPAALAPLISASRDGRLDEILAKGVVIIEKSPAIGRGRLGNYVISSDSTAFTFLTAVTDHLDPRLGQLQSEPLYHELRALGQEAVSLSKAADLLERIGRVLHQAVIEAGGLVLVEHEALRASRTSEGNWVTIARSVSSSGDQDVAVLSRNLVLATGAHQPSDRMLREFVGSTPLSPAFADKCMQSDAILQPEGVAEVKRRLATCNEPNIVVVGGSTSALATVDLLLRELPALARHPGGITLMHRRPLRIFYRSREEAREEGYVDFDEDDICPLSGFVYRLAGFRLQSRELVKKLTGIGTRERQRAVALHRLDRESDQTTGAALARADLIIAAFGYRPRALPLYGVDGEPIRLMFSTSDRAPLVDRSCRLVTALGEQLVGAFGIGLAAGFVPCGDLGGEKSFMGQANGLWLWQTAVGAIIIEAVLSQRLPSPVAACDECTGAREVGDAVLA